MLPPYVYADPFPSRPLVPLTLLPVSTSYSQPVYPHQLHSSPSPAPVLPPTPRLTVHADLLAQFSQLHLCGHVAHCPHEISQILTRDEPISVLVELKKRLPKL